MTYHQYFRGSKIFTVSPTEGQTHLQQQQMNHRIAGWFGSEATSKPPPNTPQPQAETSAPSPGCPNPPSPALGPARAGAVPAPQSNLRQGHTALIVNITRGLVKLGK